MAFVQDFIVCSDEWYENTMDDSKTFVDCLQQLVSVSEVVSKSDEHCKNYTMKTDYGENLQQ